MSLSHYPYVISFDNARTRLLGTPMSWAYGLDFEAYLIEPTGIATKLQSLRLKNV